MPQCKAFVNTKKNNNNNNKKNGKRERVNLLDTWRDKRTISGKFVAQWLYFICLISFVSYLFLFFFPVLAVCFKEDKH